MAQKEHVLVAKPELQEHCEPFLYIYFLSTTHDVHAKVKYLGNIQRNS